MVPCHDTDAFMSVGRTQASVFVLVFLSRIRKFLGFSDPDPFVGCTGPDPSIIVQK